MNSDTESVQVHNSSIPGDEGATVAFDPVRCRVPECPMTAQACDRHRPDPQVGDEVVLRGIVTQRAIDTQGRDIVQVTRGRESYWFARADHAEPAASAARSAAQPSEDS